MEYDPITKRVISGPVPTLKSFATRGELPPLLPSFPPSRLSRADSPSSSPQSSLLTYPVSIRFSMRFFSCFLLTFRSPLYQHSTTSAQHLTPSSLLSSVNAQLYNSETSNSDHQSVHLVARIAVFPFTELKADCCPFSSLGSTSERRVGSSGRGSPSRTSSRSESPTRSRR